MTAGKARIKTIWLGHPSIPQEVRQKYHLKWEGEVAVNGGLEVRVIVVVIGGLQPFGKRQLSKRSRKVLRYGELVRIGCNFTEGSIYHFQCSLVHRKARDNLKGVVKRETES